MLAQPFDPDRLKLHGDAVPIAQPVDAAGPLLPVAAFSDSDNGVLLYRTAHDDVRSQLTWFNRHGRALGTVGDPVEEMSIELSPDGTRPVVSVLDDAVGTRDL